MAYFVCVKNIEMNGNNNPPGLALIGPSRM